MLADFLRAAVEPSDEGEDETDREPLGRNFDEEKKNSQATVSSRR